jgi:hypothetical protein
MWVSSKVLHNCNTYSLKTQTFRCRGHIVDSPVLHESMLSGHFAKCIINFMKILAEFRKSLTLILYSNRHFYDVNSVEMHLMISL